MTCIKVLNKYIYIYSHSGFVWYTSTGYIGYIGIKYITYLFCINTYSEISILLRTTSYSSELLLFKVLFRTK